MRASRSFPREVDAYVVKLDPRRELVDRLAIRGLCDRCGADRRFRPRTEELRQRFASDLAAVETEAEKLAHDLAARRGIQLPKCDGRQSGIFALDPRSMRSMRTRFS